jgi:hypothetical protein
MQKDMFEKYCDFPYLYASWQFNSLRLGNN